MEDVTRISIDEVETKGTKPAAVEDANFSKGPVALSIIQYYNGYSSQDDDSECMGKRIVA